MVGVEAANERVQAERRFPDVGQQFAAAAPALDSAPPVNGGIETFVPAAPALEPSRSDLQVS